MQVEHFDNKSKESIYGDGKLVSKMERTPKSTSPLYPSGWKWKSQHMLWMEKNIAQTNQNF